MKTIGTGNLQALSDADLRTYIGAQALEVYEAVALGFGDFELQFALGTLDRFRAEHARRHLDATGALA